VSTIGDKSVWRLRFFAFCIPRDLVDGRQVFAWQMFAFCALPSKLAFERQFAIVLSLCARREPGKHWPPRE